MTSNQERKRQQHIGWQRKGDEKRATECIKIEGSDRQTKLCFVSSIAFTCKSCPLVDVPTPSNKGKGTDNHDI